MLRRAGLALCLLAAGCGGGSEDLTAPTEPRWRLDHVSESRSMVVVDVLPLGRDDGWAIAFETGSGDGDPAFALLRRDGADWGPAPDHPALRHEGGAEFTRLTASGPDDVWLFGQLAADEIAASPDLGALRWNGREWRRVPTGFTLRDAVAVAPDDVWALDASSSPVAIAHHWDGREWRQFPAPADYLDHVAASGPDDVWAAGTDDGRPAVVRFDGDGWRPVPLPRRLAVEGGRIGDLVALGPEDVWAFGYLTTGEAVSPFVTHWDGSAWREVPDTVDDAVDLMPAESALLGTVDGDGGFVLASVHGAEQHRTGTGDLAVIADPEPVPGRTDEVTDEDRRQHLQVHDLELVPGTREIWAGGAVGVSPALPPDAYARGVIASYQY